VGHRRANLTEFRLIYGVRGTAAVHLRLEFSMADNGFKEQAIAFDNGTVLDNCEAGSARTRNEPH
jgi:hypothetical protein